MSLAPIGGCASAQAPPDERENTPLIECGDARPEVCTSDYLPVCALRDTGVRCVTTPCDSSELKTFGNACSACADAKVLGYRRGACAATN